MAEDPDLTPIDEQDLPYRPMVSVPIVPEQEEPQGEFVSIETEFDPRYREPFIGLLYLGSLQDTVTKYGHTFLLVTPTQRERLAGGVLHKQFVNSIADATAWATIVVALYLNEVDDQPLPEPIGPDVSTKVRDRFNWVQDNIRPEIINQLFEDCLLLDAKVAATLKELDNQVKTAG